MLGLECLIESVEQLAGGVGKLGNEAFGTRFPFIIIGS